MAVGGSQTLFKVVQNVCSLEGKEFNYQSNKQWKMKTTRTNLRETTQNAESSTDHGKWERFVNR